MWTLPRFSCVVVLLALAGCGKKDKSPVQTAAPRPAGRVPARGSGPLRTEMKGVSFRIDPEVVLEVRHLRGRLEPTRDGAPVWFDDPTSFRIAIDEAEIAVTASSMAALMNHYTFAGPQAPVRDVTIALRDGHLVQSATLQKKIPLRATLEGEVAATPEGDLRFHPTKIETGGLPVKGLLDLFDIELSEMIKSQKSRGLEVIEDDFLLDPERLLPPPRIRGRVTAVRLEGDRIVQTFGDHQTGRQTGRALAPSFPEAEHFMFYSGGELSFGKLTMHGADLQIIDADPADPFDFFLARYQQQLIAGLSRTMPDKGLVVYMPDSDQAGTPLTTLPR